VDLNSQSNELSVASLANIEALANESDTYTFYCCGNTSTCAEGTDEDTGQKFVIHGRLSANPC
jgi:hypothetical protein